MNATTVEQGQYLLKIGVDKETADVLYYGRIADEDGNVLAEPQFDMFLKRPGMPDTKIVGWSLEALFAQMPTVTTCKGMYVPTLMTYVDTVDGKIVTKYYCCYQREDKNGEVHQLYSAFSEKPIDCVYESLTWALRNKPRIEQKD